MINTLILTGKGLTLQDVWDVAYAGRWVAISAIDAENRSIFNDIQALYGLISSEKLDDLIKGGM